MTQQSGQPAPNAAEAERLANAALQTAEKALEEARTTAGGTAARGGVRVEKSDGGIVISIPGEDGTPRLIVLNGDGDAITSVSGISTNALERGFSGRNEMPKSIMVVALFSIAAGVMILSPLMRSLARMLDRRGQSSPTSNESVQRLAAIEQAVEAVAVEVERISEGQRFTARLLSERAKDPVEVR